MVQISELQAGAKVELEDGSTAEVLAPTEDGLYVRIRYLESPFSPEVVGTEGLASEAEISAMRG